jgi:site-specific recombinase XerD
MTRGAISEVFRRRVKDAGLPLNEYSPYGLRHGFAMRLLKRGVGIKAIGDLMGHRDLSSTSTYLRLDTDALREVALAVPKSSAMSAAVGAP